MLWQRILTAIPLAIAVIWVVLSNEPLWMQVMIQCFIFVAAVEWANMSYLSHLWQRMTYAFVITVAGYFLLLWREDVVVTILCASIVWWFWYTINIRRIKPSSQPHQRPSARKLLIGLIVLLPPMLALVIASRVDGGASWIIYAVCLVWVADIGAYFSGRKWGKHKLAPIISPGKTIEGMTGALVVTSIYGLVAASYFNLDVIKTVYLIVLTAVATLFSITGDLYESLMKRERGIKDSGAILPGHGGVMDRIDSLTSALPLLVLGIDRVILA